MYQGLVVKGETHVLKFVGLNPSTYYWIDFFTLISCKNCNDCLIRKDEKEVEDGPFKKI